MEIDFTLLPGAADAQYTQLDRNALNFTFYTLFAMINENMKVS